jgi:hypothetical protein
VFIGTIRETVPTDHLPLLFVHRLVWGTRNIAAATAVADLDMELVATGFESRLEMDNCADTHAFGKNYLVCMRLGGLVLLPHSLNIITP